MKIIFRNLFDRHSGQERWLYVIVYCIVLLYQAGGKEKMRRRKKRGEKKRYHSRVDWIAALKTAEVFLV